MKLHTMQYKDYIWPHNPRTYTINYERTIALRKIPFGRYQLQNLGLTRRVLQGEGEFVGTDAYNEFKKLASVFYQEGSGTLVHPVWQSAQAYFVNLSLREEPRESYVSYTFTFWETYEGYQDKLTLQTPDTTGAPATVPTESGNLHVVQRGETLWGIANRYGVTLTQLLQCNPHIKNPNRIYVGEQVKLP